MFLKLLRRNILRTRFRCGSCDEKVAAQNLSDTFYITFNIGASQNLYIWYKNRAELFVLDVNRRPIRYAFHNGTKTYPV